MAGGDGEGLDVFDEGLIICHHHTLPWREAQRGDEVEADGDADKLPSSRSLSPRELEQQVQRRRGASIDSGGACTPG